jgi:hypothetical protein
VLFAALAALALGLSSWNAPETAARAWLCAFVLISMVPIGSLALLLVHGISGGRWGRDLAPVLEPAARSLPLLFLAFAPVIVFRPLIYQWNELKLPADVLRDYLNPLFFDARTLVALAVWTMLAWTGAWRNQLWAGLGLVAHLIAISLVPGDWVLTLRPGSTSAGFGLGFGIEQMFAALAFTAILAPQESGRATRDLAGLTVTTLLATVYFLYMQFLITWYGNIPIKVHWYAVRAGDGWALVAFAAFVLGAALPFLAILNPYVRREPGALRVVGIFVVAGVVLHVAWLTIPAFPLVVVAPAIFAALLMAFMGLVATPLLRGIAHGS